MEQKVEIPCCKCGHPTHVPADSWMAQWRCSACGAANYQKPEQVKNIGAYRGSQEEDRINLIDGEVDDLFMWGATVHLEKLTDNTFMLIVEKGKHRRHLRIGAKRARVRAWVYESSEGEDD